MYTSVDANGKFVEDPGTSGTTGNTPCVGCSGNTPYLAAPWKIFSLSGSQRDSQLIRWTTILQALAGLATVIIIVVTLAKGNK